jgi:hypothetical protein
MLPSAVVNTRNAEKERGQVLRSDIPKTGLLECKT